MSPTELFDLCMNAINRFNSGEVKAAEPFVYLVLPRDRCPTGQSVRLFGKSGPAGEVCSVKKVGDRYEVCALFKAVPIIQALGEMIGAKVHVTRRP